MFSGGTRNMMLTSKNDQLKRNYPYIILFRRFFSSLGVPEVNAMPSLWHWGFHFTKALQGERKRDGTTHLLVSPPPVPVFIICLQGWERGWVPIAGSPGSTLEQHTPSASLGSPGKPGGSSGLVWTLSHASNCEAELAVSLQTLEITAVTALVTRVDMKIWR